MKLRIMNILCCLAVTTFAGHAYAADRGTRAPYSIGQPTAATLDVPVPGSKKPFRSALEASERFRAGAGKRIATITPADAFSEAHPGSPSALLRQAKQIQRSQTEQRARLEQEKQAERTAEAAQQARRDLKMQQDAKAEAELITRLDREFEARAEHFKTNLKCRYCARNEVFDLYQSPETARLIDTLKSKCPDLKVTDLRTLDLFVNELVMKNEYIKLDQYPPYLRHMLKLIGSTFTANVFALKLGLCKDHMNKPYTQKPFQTAPLQLPSAPAEDVESKEWAALKTALDFDYEMDRTTFNDHKCRTCAHKYIFRLYESDRAQELLAYMQARSGNTKMTILELKEQIDLTARGANPITLHPYYTFLATLTQWAYCLGQCKHHREKRLQKQTRENTQAPQAAHVPTPVAPTTTPVPQATS